VEALRVKTVGMESLGDAWADMKGTLLLVGSTLLASGLAVGVSPVVRSTGPAGDVVAKTTNFRISMPSPCDPGVTRLHTQTMDQCPTKCWCSALVWQEIRSP
jgi:hypothetical protein